MSRVPSRIPTRKRTKLVYRYLVGPIGAPQFYVEDYVAAKLFFVYVPDEYSEGLGGLEQFTMGQRLFEAAPAYKAIRVDKRGALRGPERGILHVRTLEIELTGGRLIRLGGGRTS